MGQRKKPFLAKVLDICNNYQSHFKHIQLGRLCLLSDRAKNDFLVPRLVFCILDHTEKSK